MAANALSAHTGDAVFADAATRYVQAFLERCVAPNGLFQWGNHAYHDAHTDRVATFCGRCIHFRTRAADHRRSCPARLSAI